MLRALLTRALTHASNPAILRLPERSVEGVARACLARGLWLTTPDVGWTGHKRPEMYWRPGDVEPVDAILDITDSGTARAVTVALTLANGFDPGPLGMLCCLTRELSGWGLHGVDGWVLFTSDTPVRSTHDRRIEVYAPAIASDLDPVRALILAVHHVLENP